MAKQSNILNSIIVILFVLTIAACGSRPSDRTTDSGESNGASSTGGSDKIIAAMPTANFSSVGDQSGITTTTDIEAPDVEEDASSADLALGKRVYANRCAECHGPSGEGIPDKGSAVAGTQLSMDEFEDLLRTGGDIGPEHLFGTRAVSANGLAGLHAYLTKTQ